MQLRSLKPQDDEGWKDRGSNARESGDRIFLHEENYCEDDRRECRAPNMDVNVMNMKDWCEGGRGDLKKKKT